MSKNYRPLSELNLLDDFLFQEMLAQEDTNEEFCKILLTTILGKPIRKVRVTKQKIIQGIDTKKHGIRLDAYIEDVSDSDCIDANVVPDIYDIEPNKIYEPNTLPKRMRYYHSLIDKEQLSTNISYSKLPKVFIIFILPYDPFGKNRMVYTIKNQCVEDPSISYDDGATKIVLYTKGTKGNPSKNLQDMLKYIETSTDENVCNEDIDKVHHMVCHVKLKREVDISYMKSWEVEEMAREEGRAEGLAEGHAEGLAKGIAGIISVCQDVGLSKDDCIKKIITQCQLSREEAQGYLDKYWK